MMSNCNEEDERNNTDSEYRKINITYGMMDHLLHGFRDKNIYADFEAKNNEIKITPLVKALNTCRCKYVSDSSVKELRFKLLTISKFSIAAQRVLMELDDDMEADQNADYLFEMLRIHNPDFYKRNIEHLVSEKQNGIDLNDHFTIHRIADKNYINDGNIMWDSLFNDIRRGIVFIENERCAYVKVYSAVFGSHKLNRSSIKELKSRLSLIIVKLSKGENAKYITLKELLYGKEFQDIVNNYSNILRKQNVCFYSPSESTFSLFRGFNFPIRNDVVVNKIGLFLNHIKNIIANGNEILYKYILSWIAFIVQNPGKRTNTCLTLLGRDEISKRIFTDVICELFCNYSLTTATRIDDINSFNILTENKMLIVLSEVNIISNNTTDKFIHNKLKTLITKDILSINKNVTGKYKLENPSNYIIRTNEFNPFSVSEKDNLYVVAKLSNSMIKNDDYYDDLSDSLDEEFYINLYNYFRLYDIRDFDPRDIHMTKNI